MVSKKDIADELGIPTDALHFNAARWTLERQAPGNIDGNTALTASATFYCLLGIMQKACFLESGMIRSEAAGVGATTTIDILKVPSGTAVGSGTAMVTQVAANGLTAATNYALTMGTVAARTMNAGDAIVAKIVTQGVETLKPLNCQLIIK